MTTRASSSRRGPNQPKKHPAARIVSEGLPPPWSAYDFAILAGCLLATLIALWPVIQADFTSWDDPQTVAKNPWLVAPGIEAFAHFWAHPNMDLYIPVTYDVWAAVASVAVEKLPGGPGLDPHAFHAANLIVHLIATAIVFGLLRRFVGPAAAAAGTLLFGLHPVQVEPVAWVSGMKDVLCGMLCLAALFVGPLAGLSPSRNRNRNEPNISGGTGCRVIVRYVFATLLFAMALLTKPTAMVLPAIVVVIAWATGRLGRPLLPLLLRLGPWFALSLACAFWTSRIQANPPFVDSPPWMRPMVALHALGFYAVKLLAPVHLAVDYGCSPTWLAHHPVAWALGLIPIGVGCMLLMLRKAAPLLAAGAAIFLIGLAPVLGLVTFDFQFFSTVCDHYLYLPMFGIALVVAAGVAAFDPRTTSLKPSARLILAALIPLAAVSLGARSWLQARQWRDSRTLFEHTLWVNPNSLAALNTKVRLALEAHQPLEAESYARRALAVRSDYPDAIIALGSALAMQGRENEALEQFQRAVLIAPDSPDALVNLGIALAKGKHLAEAESLFSRAVQMAPENAHAHLQLGTLYLQQQRVNASLQQYELATRLDPQDAEAHTDLGWVLTRINPDRAREQFAAALEIDPAFPPALKGMQYCNSARRP